MGSQDASIDVSNGTVIERFVFFSPGIIMSLAVSFLMIFIVFVGFYGLYTMHGPERFEKKTN